MDTGCAHGSYEDENDRSHPAEPVSGSIARRSRTDMFVMKSWVAIKRFGCALFIGGAITLLPWLMRNFEALWPINFLLAPGAIVALLISGNVHIYSQLILYAVNLAFFSFVTYVLLQARHRKP